MDKVQSVPGDELSEVALDYLNYLERAGIQWKCLELRVVALYAGQQWRNLLTRARLLPAQPQQVGPDEFRTSHILARRSFLPPSAIRELLSGLNQGQIVIGEDAIEYRSGVRQAASGIYSEHWGKKDSGKTQFWLMPAWSPAHPSPWSSLEFMAAGDAFSELLRLNGWKDSDLDPHVHDSGLPFDGFEGLVEGMLGLRTSRQGDRNAQFRIEAPLPARTDNEHSSLVRGQLALQVEAASHEVLATTSVGIAAYSRGNLIFADVTRPEPTESDAQSILKRGKLVISDLSADRVVVTLRLGSLHVDTLSIEDPSLGGQNARMAMFGSVDHGLELLSSLLYQDSSAKPDTHGFERAVARLLFLVGLQSVHMGPEGKLSNSPDVMAFDPHSPLVYAVECTIGAIDAGGKLGKLFHRTRELEQIIGREIQPVLATSASRDALSSADMRDAARDRISVIAREDMDVLIAVAVAGGSTRDASGIIATRIPILSRDPVVRGPPGLGGIRG